MGQNHVFKRFWDDLEAGIGISIEKNQLDFQNILKWSLGSRGVNFTPPRVSHQAKKSQNKTPEVFFHAAFDFDAPRPQNTLQKWKINQKPDL